MAHPGIRLQTAVHACGRTRADRDWASQAPDGFVVQLCIVLSRSQAFDGRGLGKFRESGVRRLDGLGSV
jgi:hypothetical protein